jgi:hypothetical protein
LLLLNSHWNGEIVLHRDQEDHLKKLLIALGLFVAPITTPVLLQTETAIAAPTTSKLGDLSALRKIVADTLALVQTGKTKAAIKRITEFETAWDQNAKRLRAVDTETWRKLDDASDVALSTVRYPSATPDEMKKDLSDLIKMLDNPSL